MIFSMALINFFSRLTYENILSPMLLARSGGNEQIMGLVSSVMGMGGIAGGLLVATGKIKGRPVRMIYLSAAFSFLFGDLGIGMGRGAWSWCLAGLAASVPIPFVAAGQRIILYHRVPREIQGRIFAARNALQYCSIPAGLLLGGCWPTMYLNRSCRGDRRGTAAWQAGWDRERKRNGADVPVHRRAWSNVNPLLVLQQGNTEAGGRAGVTALYKMQGENSICFLPCFFV